MYIRAVKQTKKKGGPTYITYRLVEAYRNAEGKVRQQVLLSLGCDFQVPQEEWKLLANRIEDIHKGQQSFFGLDENLEKEAQRIAKSILKKYTTASDLDGSNPNVHVKDHQMVDVNSLEHKDITKIGGEYVGLFAAQQLGLEKILETCGMNQKQIKTALGSVIGRLVCPGSELKTHRYLKEHSALDELLGTDFSNLPLKNLYNVSDLLLKNKEAIEAALYNQEKDLFNLTDMVTLYDITNTYFEGRSLGNPKAQYGRSKEKRNDCCLVALGMLLDASGFPKKSKIYPGNVSEPKTLKEMLTLLEGTPCATVVMDAGIATEENIEWLTSQGYKYIVVSRKQNLVAPDEADTVVVKDSTSNQVTATLVTNEKTNELELYCHSQAKQAKSQQMVSKASSRYEAELKKLSSGLHKKGTTKRYGKVLEKLGRLKEKYRKVARLYDVTVTADEANNFATSITWELNQVALEEKQSGIYCLRTNQTELDAHSFWKIYTMLTDLEAAFRSLKSELGLRPIYHQKESRIDGHLFISILAYHLLHTVRYQLKQKGILHSWQTLRDLLSTQCRITSLMKLEDGQTLSIRKTSSPDTNQSIIYKALGMASHPGKTIKTYH